MEKSHHAAKAANQRHTQHGGGRGRKSCILQQYEHWYRNIQHRYAAKVRMEEANNVFTDQDEVDATNRRREASNNSNAAEAHELWRATRVRVGSVWKEIEE